MNLDQILSHLGKVGCWHGNGSRNTDRTYGGLECVMRGFWDWARREVCVFGGGAANRQTLTTKEVFRIYDRYG